MRDFSGDDGNTLFLKGVKAMQVFIFIKTLQLIAVPFNVCTSCHMKNNQKNKVRSGS